MIPSPKLLRAAVRARERADRAAEVAERLEREAADAETAAGVDIDALRRARKNLPPDADPAHKAILDAGLTVERAAELCGTSKDFLRKAWSPGAQFRPAPKEWRHELARFGVPLTAWRDRV